MINIKHIDRKEIRSFLDSLDLVSASSEWERFLSFDEWKPFDYGVFENEELQFIIPGFTDEQNQMWGSIPKLYHTEPISWTKSLSAFPETALELLKQEEKFKSLTFSWSFILNPGQLAKKYRMVTHILKTHDLDEKNIFETILSKKTRNQIRASHERGNFKLVINSDVDSFYSMYRDSMKRLKSIPKEKDFFDKLHKSFGDSLFILNAYKGDAYAGANMVLVKNKMLYLPFNVSRSKYFPLYVNDFLYWETIRFGLNRGINIFDFGASVISDKSHQHFKEGFGAKLLPIYKFTHYNSWKLRLNDFLARKWRNMRLRFKKLL